MSGKTDRTITAHEFQNGHPYTNIAGELVANCIVVMEAVRERRPKSRTWAAPFMYRSTPSMASSLWDSHKRMAR